MNVFNRLIAILALIVGWTVVVAVAAVPDVMLAVAGASLETLQNVFGLLDSVNPGWLLPAIRAILIILATVVLLVLLWAELRRAETPAVRVRLTSGGEAVVTADSVARRLAWHLDQLADVISVKPTVQRRGNSVDVHLALETAPDIEVPMKTEEVMAVAREVLEERMGLQVRKLKVEIRHAPFEEELGAMV